MNMTDKFEVAVEFLHEYSKDKGETMHMTYEMYHGIIRQAYLGLEGNDQLRLKSLAQEVETIPNYHVDGKSEPAQLRKNLEIIASRFSRT